VRFHSDLKRKGAKGKGKDIFVHLSFQWDARNKNEVQEAIAFFLVDVVVYGSAKTNFVKWLRKVHNPNPNPIGVPNNITN